eukprot:CAMPEP_0116558478 /NCGR_PEP_ID=MMETSP0397-20121206/9834_1 /TAXON_ID=216820 /ORGANISM="Cyclophora tenuis, Strain ECT3854" /LENGTH=50 /DNA_ID=CAMNT_0004084083 /DNA_START=966 /DNA_END=1118 /DNA_ORIENTATION=-
MAENFWDGTTCDAMFERRCWNNVIGVVGFLWRIVAHQLLPQSTSVEFGDT